MSGFCLFIGIEAETYDIKQTKTQAKTDTQPQVSNHLVWILALLAWRNTVERERQAKKAMCKC